MHVYIHVYICIHSHASHSVNATYALKIMPRNIPRIFKSTNGPSPLRIVSINTHSARLSNVGATLSTLMNHNEHTHEVCAPCTDFALSRALTFMCIYLHIRYTFMCIYIHIHVYIRTHSCVYTYIFMCMYTDITSLASLDVLTRCTYVTNTYTHIHMHAWIQAHGFVSTLCMYVHT